MGTILFLILKLLGKIDTVGFDWVILCFLVSLDSMGASHLKKMCGK